jgi:hypothetical protein
MDRFPKTVMYSWFPRDIVLQICLSVQPILLPELVENVHAVGTKRLWIFFVWYVKDKCKGNYILEIFCSIPGKVRRIVVLIMSLNVVNNDRERVLKIGSASSIPVFCVCSNMLWKSSFIQACCNKWNKLAHYIVQEILHNINKQTIKWYNVWVSFFDISVALIHSCMDKDIDAG